MVITEAEHGEMQAVLSQFFEKQADGYHNKRADAEIQKALSISEKRAKAGSYGGRRKASKSVANATQMPTQPQPQPQPHISSEGLAIDGQVHEIARANCLDLRNCD